MIRTHVDLFSGIGGFSLAASWCGVETIAFAEIDPYASKILKRHWPEIRNYGDVRDVPAIPDVWLVTGGVPCQPASVAGKRRGAADDRWLWPQALAAVERIRPAWVLFENPTGILSLDDGMEFERICVALESQGYEVAPIVVPACGVGALHRRNRVWITAHAEGKQDWRLQFSELWSNTRRSRETDVADTNGGRRQQRNVGERGVSIANQNGWWSVEPDVGRLADGVSDRVGKLRCLGNAIVPQVAYQLIKRMIEAEETLLSPEGRGLK